MDTLDAARRSALMSRIGRKDTKPEIAVRSYLHRLGFRFRLHASELPGTPDIVLPRYATVVLVHGCFWHRHGCSRSSMPKTRPEFWTRKFETNVARDERVRKALRALGWKVIEVWQCEVGDSAALRRRFRSLIASRARSSR